MISTSSAIPTILATPMAQVVSTSDLLNQTNNLLSLIGIIGGLFGAAFTIAFVILGFLIWRHLDQSRRAQKEVEKIEQLGKTANDLFRGYKDHYSEMDKILKLFASSSESIAKNTKIINNLSTQAKKRGANIEQIEKEIKRSQESINKEAKKLSNVAEYTSSIPVLTSNPVTFPADIISIADLPGAKALADYGAKVASVYSQIPTDAIKRYSEIIEESTKNLQNTIAKNPLIWRGDKTKEDKT